MPLIFATFRPWAPAWAVAFLLALALSTSGCAVHRPVVDDCYAFARADDFERALATLDASSLAKSRRDRLLFLMEKGKLLRLKGDYRQSFTVFNEADHLAEELFTRSLSAEGLSFLSNDNVIPYAGEDFESVYLNYYKALNFLALGDLEGARIESRKVDEKLNYFTDSYKGSNTFRESAFLRLLTGLIYEAEGDFNNAFIAYRRSLEAYGAYRKVYGVSVPELLWDRLLFTARRSGLREEHEAVLEQARAAGLEPQPRGTVLVVLVENGFVPAKREAAVIFPTVHGFPVKLALPEYQSRPRPVQRVEVALEGGAWLPAERVENLEAIARQSLEDKKGRVVAKLIARAAAKQIAARQAQKELGPLAGLTAQVAALLTENADLRAWGSLPGEVLMAVVPVEPGEHALRVRLGGREETHHVKVTENGVGFLSLRVF